MKKIFVTTFNKKLYDRYAHKLINSYIETKQSAPLYCYVEDDIKLYPKNKNIFFINLFSSQPECYNFVKRNKEKYNNISKQNYLLDAVRFCYKVFAQSDSRKFGDHIFYIDSDTEFVKKIPNGWFDDCLPSDTFLTLHERLGYYTESGFLAFNNQILNKKKTKIADEFFNLYTRYYTYDLIYSLPAFTDCHALDATRWRFKFLRNTVLEYSNFKENNLKVKSNTIITNVSDNELISPYIIHNKGNLKRTI